MKTGFHIYVKFWNHCSLLPKLVTLNDTKLASANLCTRRFLFTTCSALNIFLDKYESATNMPMVSTLLIELFRLIIFLRQKLLR